MLEVSALPECVNCSIEAMLQCGQRPCCGGEGEESEVLLCRRSCALFRPPPRLLFILNPSVPCAPEDGDQNASRIGRCNGEVENRYRQ